MRGVHYYYSKFQRALDAYDAAAGREFRAFSETHSQREVFLWLEQRRVGSQLPPDIEGLLTDFYWEIA